MKKILTGIGAVIGLVIILIGIQALIEVGYEYFLKKETVFLVAGNLSIIPFILGMATLVTFLWLFAPNGIYLNGDARQKANMPLRRKFLVAGVTFFFLICGSVGSALWFDCFKVDGVETRHFFVKREYSWSEVEYVTLESDWHEVLIFVMHMEDGTKHYFNGGNFRAAEYTSEAFDKEFPDGPYDYMVWLAEELRDKNVELRIKNREKLMSGLSYSWDELAGEVINMWERR